ncbi:MAG TPA: AraC family transcriptional regulator [Capsulimonadaceae bacterium]|nr:AraC family transcriptional regulator [Capsulimonadaceae bacterium]
MAETGQRTILYNGVQISPLGRLTLAARIERGKGIVPAQPYRVYGSYALVYITEGNGRYSDSNGLAQEIHAGDAILVFPELPHTYGPQPGRTWSELYLVFDGPAVDSWREIGILSAQRPIYHLEPIARWTERFLEVVGAETVQTGRDSSLQICRLLTLLTEIAELNSSAAPSRDDRQWLTKACIILREDLASQGRLDHFAAKLGLSTQAFRKRFKQELGMAPAQYRANRRIETACDLLQYTRMTNAQIAESLGFSDEYHFSKRFKEMRGESPREFRRRQLR